MLHEYATNRHPLFKFYKHPSYFLTGDAIDDELMTAQLELRLTSLPASRNKQLQKSNTSRLGWLKTISQETYFYRPNIIIMNLDDLKFNFIRLFSRPLRFSLTVYLRTAFNYFVFLNVVQFVAIQIAHQLAASQTLWLSVQKEGNTLKNQKKNSCN